MRSAVRIWSRSWAQNKDIRKRVGRHKAEAGNVSGCCCGRLFHCRALCFPRLPAELLSTLPVQYFMEDSTHSFCRICSIFSFSLAIFFSPCLLGSQEMIWPRVYILKSKVWQLEESSRIWGLVLLLLQCVSPYVSPFLSRTSHWIHSFNYME